MTLQQLIGELQTLALAYPPGTIVRVDWREMDAAELVGVKAQSHPDELVIVLEAQ